MNNNGNMNDYSNLNVTFYDIENNSKTKEKAHNIHELLINADTLQNNVDLNEKEIQKIKKLRMNNEQSIQKASFQINDGNVTPKFISRNFKKNINIKTNIDQTGNQQKFKEPITSEDSERVVITYENNQINEEKIINSQQQTKMEEQQLTTHVENLQFASLDFGLMNVSKFKDNDEMSLPPIFNAQNNQEEEEERRNTKKRMYRQQSLQKEENKIKHSKGAITAKKLSSTMEKNLNKLKQKNEQCDDEIEKPKLFDELEEISDDERDGHHHNILSTLKNKFKQLTQRIRCETNHAVQSVTISNLGKKAIVVLTEKLNEIVHVHTYDLATGATGHVIKITGIYVKCDSISQNDKGTQYCLPYFDSGFFNLIIFNNDAEITHRLKNINKMIGIDIKSRPSHWFQNPDIHVVFYKDHILFVSLFQQKETFNWHFFYDMINNRIIGMPIGTQLKCDCENFLYNVTYDPEQNEFYIFYRHGQCITVNCPDLSTVYEGIQKSNGQRVYGSIESRSLHENTLQTKTLSENRYGGEQFWTISQDKQHLMEQNIQIEQPTTGFGYICYSPGKQLMSRIKKKIYFFKRQRLTTEQQTLNVNKKIKSHWHVYHKLEISGSLSYNRLRNLLFVVQKTNIYMFRINQLSLMPKLENVISNFMQCNDFIYGPLERYCVTYKQQQQNFTCYSVSCHHTFDYVLDNKNRCGSNVQNLVGDALCIAKQHSIQFFNSVNFNEITQIEVIKRNDDNCKIVNIKLSNDGTQLAVIIGQEKSNTTFKLSKLYIYEVPKFLKEPEELANQDALKLKYETDLSQEASSLAFNFEFHNRIQDSLLCADAEQIYNLNYGTQIQNGTSGNYSNQNMKYANLQPHYQFNFALQSNPDFLVFNKKQNLVLIAAQEDVLMIDLLKNKEIDIDQLFFIADIRACIYNKGHFYILANKYKKVRGIFLLDIDESKIGINNNTMGRFIYKLKNLLEIGDASIYFMKGKNNESNIINTSFKATIDTIFQEQRDYLVICYKAIWVNTFTVSVVSLSCNDLGSILVRHEANHLWEAQITGSLQDGDNFIILSGKGASVLSFDQANPSKTIQRDTDEVYVLHSLLQFDYLKFHESNQILFVHGIDTERNKHKTTIKIEDLQEISVGKDEKFTTFTDIYQISIQQMYLNDILLLQSLISSQCQTDISKLIKQQPNPEFFYKSFLELGIANLASLLSFDSQSVVVLLNDQYKEFFNSDDPIFYRIKNNDVILKKDVSYLSAIDIALDNNQIIALNLITNYMATYQDRYFFATLFRSNFVSLLKTGISLNKLLDSDLIMHKFDFEEWPTTSLSCKEKIFPYNGSIFELRTQYNNTIQDNLEPGKMKKHKHGDEKQEKAKKKNIATMSIKEHVPCTSVKIYKVNYVINLIPSLAEDQNELMQILGDLEDLDILTTKAVQGLINYKWNTYAKKVHYFGAIIHSIYVASFFFYVNFIYLREEEEFQLPFICIMLICHIYTTLYDLRQLYRQKIEYFRDKWNYVDQAHIWSGFINFYIQVFNKHGKTFTHDEQNHQAIRQHFLQSDRQILMIFVTFMLLIKTFFFLRIFDNLTRLVIMIKEVIFQLTDFIIFYIIVIFMFSVVIGILGVGNYNLEADQEMMVGDYPSFEYDKLKYQVNDSSGQKEGKQWGILVNFFIVLRYSLGDYGEFREIEFLNSQETMIFWILWVIIILMTSIIFLNFIIAEVSDSYAKVQNFVLQLVLQERAKLIDECEDMLPVKYKEAGGKNAKLFFPTYLISRQTEKI